MKPLLVVLLAVYMMPPLAGAEERMGRLFFTPAERTSLDYVRQTSRPPEKIIRADEENENLEDIAEAAPAAAAAPVTLQGFVKRSDGKGTVWVNRQPMREKSASKEAEVGRLNGGSGRVAVKLPGGQVVELKAGQTYDPVSGRVVENLRELPDSQAHATTSAVSPAANPSEPLSPEMSKQTVVPESSRSPKVAPVGKP